MRMIDKLEIAEGEIPRLIEYGDAWTGVYADTAKPHLKRLWFQWGDDRLYLHLFEGCGLDESYEHPHPWLSAMRVWGRYEMGVGHVSTPKDDLVVVRLEPGSAYEMTSRNSAHWVRPMEESCFTVMLAGQVVFPEHRISAQKKVRGLKEAEREELFALARRHYAK